MWYAIALAGVNHHSIVGILVRITRATTPDKSTPLSVQSIENS